VRQPSTLLSLAHAFERMMDSIQRENGAPPAMLIPQGIQPETRTLAQTSSNIGSHGKSFRSADEQDAVLTGVSEALLTEPNSQSKAGALSTTDAISPESKTTNVALSEPVELDPLTPRAVTATASTALTRVLDSIVTTLEPLINNTESATPQALRLLQSPAFVQILQLASASESSYNSVSFDTALTQAPTQSTDPNLQRLLAELESTFHKRTAPGLSAAIPSADASPEDSDLDMLLHWLASSTSHTVVASA
jgi:hypothetical protein